MERHERIAKAIAASGKKKGEIAAECGVANSAVTQWINGDSKSLKPENLYALAKATGFRAEWLAIGQGSEREAQAEDKESNVHAVDFSRPRSKAGEILIPQYDVRASMGPGQVLPSSYVDTIRHIAVSPDYLREAGVAYTAARNLAVVTGFGESMNKTFSSGDPLIIDRGVNELVTDGVYLFTLAGMLYIKRLQLLPGRIRMISDNDAFPPYDIQGAEADQLTIHARVLLAWNARKL